MTDFAAARRTMVENQLRTYDITDHTVLTAFETVPRHAFVDERQSAIAYLDRELTARGGKARLLTPMVHARFVQEMNIKAGERALDVGGAGYGAAILAACGTKVVALESDAESARASLAAAGVSDIEVVAGDAGAGAPGKGQFDLIMVHGAAEIAPDSLLALLKDGGRLAIVMGHGRSGRATLFRRIGASFSHARVFDAAAPALAAFNRKSEFTF